MRWLSSGLRQSYRATDLRTQRQSEGFQSADSPVCFKSVFNDMVIKHWEGRVQSFKACCEVPKYSRKDELSLIGGLCHLKGLVTLDVLVTLTFSRSNPPLTG